MPSADSLTQLELETANAGKRDHWRVILILLFAGGILLAWIAQRAVLSAARTERRADLIIQDRFDVSIPKAEYTPEQVVDMQIASLQAAMLDNERLIECYSFAAPSNRASTGPFENFSALVKAYPYNELGKCVAYQVGTAVIEGDAAAVLVTLLSDRDQSLAFRFVLGKQKQAPYAGCWMTEGVFALHNDDNSNLNNASTAHGASVEGVAKSRGTRVD